MSTELAIRHEPVQLTTLTNEQLQYIANTEFVPRDLRGNLPAILACVATGRALGIADITALRSIHIIDGRPTYSAELMVMLARRYGHSIQGEVDEGKAEVRGRRADNGDEMRVTWTLKMAERAGLLGKQNWRKYPEAMLWARAVSQLCRELFPDCFAGATYVPEELEGSAGEPGDPGSVGTDPEPSVKASAAELGSSPADDFSPEAKGSEPAKPAPAATAAQKKKLDILVARLAEKEPNAKHRVWTIIALMRVRETEALIRALEGVDADGVLHWSPLRDTLTKREASELITRLEALEGEPNG